jgi:hypothetical protein
MFVDIIKHTVKEQDKAQRVLIFTNYYTYSMTNYILFRYLNHIGAKPKVTFTLSRKGSIMKFKTCNLCGKPIESYNENPRIEQYERKWSVHYECVENQIDINVNDPAIQQQLHAKLNSTRN